MLVAENDDLYKRVITLEREIKKAKREKEQALKVSFGPQQTSSVGHTSEHSEDAPTRMEIGEEEEDAAMTASSSSEPRRMVRFSLNKDQKPREEGSGWEAKGGLLDRIGKMIEVSTKAIIARVEAVETALAFLISPKGT